MESIPKPKASQYRHFKTPTVIQMEASECGAAALCTILQYYGSYPSLEEVRTLCAVSRDGVNAMNIALAAQSYGLEVEGYKMELEELYDASLPLIVHWDFNHFIVIEGFAKNSVYINDPATGPREISYEDLDKYFTGVALTFSKTSEFKKVDSEERMWSRILKRIRLFHSPVLYTILLGILAVVPVLAYASLSKAFIDNVLMARFDTWEWGVITGMVLLVLGGTLLQFLQSWISMRFSIQLSTLLSTQFIWHLLNVPLQFMFRRYAGEVASRMALNQSVADTFIESVFGLIVSLFFATIFATVMFFYDVPMTLVSIGLVATNLFLLSFLYRSRADAYANYRQAQGYLAALSVSGLENIESLKALSGEYQFIERFNGAYTHSLNTLQRMSKVDVILGTLSPFLNTIAYSVILVLGAWRIMQGYLTVGDFFALQILYSNFSQPVSSLINANQTLQLLSINTQRIDDVLSYPKDPLRTEEKSDEPFDIQGGIEVNHLSFGFHPLDEPLLKDIHLQVKPGSFVAIVGPSGSGKSTLVKLLGRLLKPWSGEIYYDGLPAQEVFSRNASRSIAFVEQLPMLFEDSIKNNLTLMDRTIDNESLIKATQDACIHEEVMKRPGGFQSLINRQGSNFSGGQCQRLEIACALARNPRLIILDEATSAVDALTEGEIFNNIRNRGCTVVVITHRMQAVKGCDEIFVMNNGRLAERGTHSELMQSSPLYQALVAAESEAR